MTFGEYLKKKRKAKRQSQQEAAADVGVTYKTWISWERGAEPRAGRLPSIARWAGITLNKLAPYLEKFSAE
jgi:transcriptional regulator with XRE-family HTH domain